MFNLDSLMSIAALPPETIEEPEEAPVRPPIDVEALVGTTIAGRYFVERVSGRGGVGTVYECRQLGLNRRVALKVLRPDSSLQDGAIERFQREARLSAQLQHPSIVVVHDFDVMSDGQPYLVMEYLSGPTLAELIRTTAALPLDETARHLVGVAGAVEALHRVSIIHRDIKPANIILPTAGDDLGVAKVVDFGVARLGALRAPEPSVRHIAGTPGYMAPELLAGNEPSVESDVYALGVTAFEALTGRMPLEAPSVRELIVKHLHREIPLPTSLRPELPSGIDEVLLRALDMAPERRYASAAELGFALTAVLAGEPAPASRVPEQPVWVVPSESAPVVSDDRPTAVASVLVVEDNEVQRVVLEAVLAGNSYNVTCAVDGADALLCLGRGRFDLIVSDIDMPHLDGITLRRVLAERGLETPVLFLSGASQAEYEDDLAASGVAGFLPKPLDVNLLLAAVRRALGPSAPVEATSTHDELVVPLIDPERVASIRALGRGASSDLFTALVVSYTKSTHTWLAEIGGACEGGDLAKCVLAAQQIKSGSAAVGATRMLALAGRIERKAASRDLDAVAETARQIEITFGETLETLDRALTGEDGLSRHD